MNLFPAMQPGGPTPRPITADDVAGTPAPDAEALARAVVAAVTAVRYRFDDEKGLQEGLAAVLSGAGFQVVREFVLGAGDVVDLFVADAVAVEVKVGGGLSAVTRQLHRYAGHEAVRAVVLVTALRRLNNLPPTLRGKPLGVAVVGGAFL